MADEKAVKQKFSLDSSISAAFDAITPGNHELLTLNAEPERQVKAFISRKFVEWHLTNETLEDEPNASSWLASVSYRITFAAIFDLMKVKLVRRVVFFSHMKEDLWKDRYSIEAQDDAAKKEFVQLRPKSDEYYGDALEWEYKFLKSLRGGKYLVQYRLATFEMEDPTSRSAQSVQPSKEGRKKRKATGRKRKATGNKADNANPLSKKKTTDALHSCELPSGERFPMPKKAVEEQKDAMKKNEFTCSNEEIEIKIEGSTLRGKPRVFKSGNCGWYLCGKIRIQIDEKVRVWCQTGINMSVLGSKFWGAGTEKTCEPDKTFHSCTLPKGEKPPPPAKIIKEQNNIMTRTHFLESRRRVELSIKSAKLTGKPRLFSSGACGWYLGGKVPVRLMGGKLWTQVGINISVLGSKTWSHT